MRSGRASRVESREQDETDWSGSDIQMLRRRIESIDREMLELLDMRAGVALRIGGIKKGLGLPPTDPAREEQVLCSVGAMRCRNLPAGEVRKVFSGIVRACRELQQRADRADRTDARKEGGDGADR